MDKCIIKSCQNTKKLHGFPNNSKEFYDWCSRIGLSLKMKNCKNYRICDRHFDDTMKCKKRNFRGHEGNSITTSPVVVAGGKRPQHNISCGPSSSSADLLLQSPVHKKRREVGIPCSCASAEFIRANVVMNSEESDKTLKNHLREDPFTVIDKIEIDEEDILDKHKSEIKTKTVEESGGFISAFVVLNCEESDKTLRNPLGEDPFLVIDKIETHEEDILDKIQSDIKSDNVEEAVDVLKDSKGLIVNNHLETIAYEDYDACSSPKHSESLITFNNKTTTNSTLSITEESQENDVLHLNKVAELARKIKMIEQSFDIKHKRKDKKLPLTSERELYKCDVCEKIFRKSDIIRHKRTHTGEELLFECNICRKKFSQLSTCRNHVLKHTGEKSYECICGMKFNRLWKSINHERKHKHIGEKQLERKRVGEKQLERTHKGEKLFKCNTCGKEYVRLSTLHNHERKHTGKKLYKCEICEKGFIRSDALVAHKKTHKEGKKPFECKICGEKFTHVWKRLHHERTEHIDEKQET